MGKCSRSGFFSLFLDQEVFIFTEKLHSVLNTAGKTKKRFFPASLNGSLLPPFKTPKPRSKTFKDVPLIETVTFKEEQTKKMIEDSQLHAFQNYTA